MAAMISSISVKPRCARFTILIEPSTSLLFCSTSKEAYHFTVARNYSRRPPPERR